MRASIGGNPDMRASGYGEFKAGWPVVLSSMIGIGLGLSPLPFYTTGVFAPYLHQAFGWTLSQVMAGITVSTAVVLFAGPLAGFLAVRFGARRMVLSSLIMFGLAFMAFALSNGSLPLYYATWAFAALVGAGTLPMTWTVAVNQRFDAKKGLALGISLMGTGLFGFFSKPFMAWMMHDFGWRWAYVGLSLLPLGIALPLAFFLFFEKPAAARTGPAIAAPAGEGLTFGETLKQWRFWLIAFILIPVSFALAGPIPNMENILKTAHFGVKEIVALTSLIGLSALSGRFVGGWLLDRFWAPAVALVILASPGASCFLLAQASVSSAAAMVSIILIGFAVGVEYDLMAFLVARYFGMRAYTAIYGVLYAFFSVGAGVGPLLFGWSFEATGSYRLILNAAFASLLICGAALLCLGRYRYARRNDAEAAFTAAAADSPAIIPSVVAAQSPIAGK
jgi:predicted MFS family arabinose efflux permease